MCSTHEPEIGERYIRPRLTIGDGCVRSKLVWRQAESLGERARAARRGSIVGERLARFSDCKRLADETAVAGRACQRWMTAPLTSVKRGSEMLAHSTG